MSGISGQSGQKEHIDFSVSVSGTGEVFFYKIEEAARESFAFLARKLEAGSCLRLVRTRIVRDRKNQLLASDVQVLCSLLKPGSEEKGE